MVGIALLGIAQRSVTVEYGDKVKMGQGHKLLIESVKTIGEWIRVMRETKNMTQGHVGLKMGIAQTMVRSWEDGTKEPDVSQTAKMEGIFGVPVLNHHLK